jgi:hypothetical protein
MLRRDLGSAPAAAASGSVNQEILDAIAKAKAAKPKGTDFSYDEKDVILYSERKTRSISGNLC